MTRGPSDPSAAFLKRLLTSIRLGHRLDDPRNPEILQRWAAIAKGLPDTALTQIVPATLRGLLRRDDVAQSLIERCGVQPDLPMQHEAIAPFIISYRRYLAARGQSPQMEKAQRAINELRAELRRLRDHFNAMFDQAGALEMERETLAAENASLQQRLLAETLRAEEAQRRLCEAQDRAIRMFRLYLFMLKEEHGRRSNDPTRERLARAEMAVEAHAATLEALGIADRAETQARNVLGDALYARYRALADEAAAPETQSNVHPFPGALRRDG